ncbi:MAG: N-acetylgalactosamine 6-sulfate sulfatase [Verrucomicrobia bacterium]|jgi:arylsulfatase A-like enzyme|nr:N-acetylgalactosamine 6-sulfate sulfatase [Verrucomicrobiota bacterium]
MKTKYTVITAPRSWRQTVWTLALFCCLILGSENLRAADKPLNFIFILVDDLGWTDFACFGSKAYQTPNIDRLAQEGMKFTSAYSACTVCSPTRAALLTGKYPARLHITDWIAGHNRPYARLKIPDWQKFLPLEEVTVAEMLKTKGYTTASIGKWHLGGEEFAPTKQGFDVNVAGYDRGAPPSYHAPYNIPTLKPEGAPGEYLTDREALEATKFIEANKEKPFFIYLPHYAVHTPIQAKAEVTKKYEKSIPANSRQNNPAYAALVESVDDSLGTIMKKLAELKIDDRTVIFITGDNGGLSGTVNAQGWKKGPTDNTPLRLGKGSAYEGGVRVPLIVKWPGVTKGGSENETPVITVDYFPTILEMAGAKPAGAIDGESLVPLLRGRSKLQREAIYWHYPHYHPGSATPYSAIRKGDLKLIHFFEEDRVELYNVKKDISEKTDLAKTEAKKTAELRKELNDWRTAVGAQLPTPNPNYDAARVWEADRPAGKGKQKAAKEE